MSLYIGGEWAVGGAKDMQWFATYIRMYPTRLVTLVHLTSEDGTHRESRNVVGIFARTSCKNPETRKQYLFHGESLKSRLKKYFKSKRNT
jgi:hypothetical protein